MVAREHKGAVPEQSIYSGQAKQQMSTALSCDCDGIKFPQSDTPAFHPRLPKISFLTQHKPFVGFTLNYALSLHFFRVFPLSVALLMSLPTSFLNFNSHPSNSRVVHLTTLTAMIPRFITQIRQMQWSVATSRLQTQSLKKGEKVLTLLFIVRKIN